MYSFVFPMDMNRVEQFTVTKRLYDKMPQTKEFIIPTRSYKELKKELQKRNLMDDVILVPYEVEVGFNPSKAFNIGVRKSNYNNIIITSPEVAPKTNVLEQLEALVGKNVICQVWDEDDKGNQFMSLVNSSFRQSTPAYYFLAMFNKDDIYAINGWDEEFMKGYAYEDNDFGDRWVRAGLPFEIHDEIQAVHQYHPRSETIKGGSTVNHEHYINNNILGIIKPEKGLVL